MSRWRLPRALHTCAANVWSAAGRGGARHAALAKPAAIRGSRQPQAVGADPAPRLETVLAPATLVLHYFLRTPALAGPTTMQRIFLKIVGPAAVGILTSLLSSGLRAEPLTQTGDVGRIADAQGVTSVRAKGGSRWSLAAPGFPLQAGDWLRTDARGANALHLRLNGGGVATLGPGTLVEVADADSLTLVRGEIEAAALPGTAHSLEILPAPGQPHAVRDGARMILRRADAKPIEMMEKQPAWLHSFKTSLTTEAMGSLLAKVDGRNTPLSLGYHKVTVDIRDQIARTVVEESFVNHTNGNLEGVFYFPLPQDASISGFGMWINGELVEADVVEKQRAREIYETILRERRDPGLLEWSGGNLFKARVFPIPPNAEKRVKITYTQVLPLRHGVFHYRYALQSEMLRLNPLRELTINVRVNSALPVSSISCPTHTARIARTEHAAQAEFTAQQYSPQQDFELDVAVDAAAAPVLLLPHRRGEDGYFLALVTPPADAAGWTRELVSDGPPLHLVILADTSGSMDDAARANQDALIGALLTSLGERDSFELATCDCETRWAPVDDGPPDTARVAAARGFVAARTSLGWSDLDRAFATVCQRVRATPGAQVIYIGDGIITNGDADPVAFAKRLQRLAANSGATFHAVAPTSRYEPAVLKAIAAIGGGSQQRIGGTDTPATVAQRLLVQMARPGIRDLKVAFEGLRTARVYPQELPNLPDGEQQVILGRYLPDGTTQSGKILVTGTRAGKPVTYSAPVALADAQDGNSFIPRLWARLQLDSLLEQGTGPAIKDEIIALSEQYKIMTPYTSLLVLESDADRARFAVKPRFAMRDGERFFAQGRDDSQQELLAAQMRAAGSWRTHLRRGYLMDLQRLGRDYLPQSQWQPAGAVGGSFGYARSTTFSGGSLGVNHGLVNFDLSGDSSFTDSARSDLAFSDEIGGNILNWNMPSSTRAPSQQSGDQFGEEDAAAARPGGGETDALEKPEAEREDFFSAGSDVDGFADDGVAQNMTISSRLLNRAEFTDNKPLDIDGRWQFSFADKKLDLDLGRRSRSLSASSDYRSSPNYDSYHWRNRVQDLVALFPQAIAKAGPTMPERAAPAEPHPWPAEAVALADSLRRADKLAALRDGGVSIACKLTTYDVRRNEVTMVTGTEAWLSGRAWVVKSFGERQDTRIEWWTEDTKRGRMALALGLGRTRPQIPNEDRSDYPAFLTDSSQLSLAGSQRHLRASVKPAAAERTVVLELADPNDGGSRSRYLIDTARHALLEVTHSKDGKVTSSEVFAEFVEVAGCWWAQRAESRNAGGKPTVVTEMRVAARNDGEFLAGFDALVKPREQVLFIDGELPTTNAAKLADLTGKQSFEGAFSLLNHFAETQQWERANTQFEALRKHAAGKPGLAALETRLLTMQRRNDEARLRILDAARTLAATPRDHELFLAERLRSEAMPVASAAEQHELLQLLKPTYQRATQHLFAMRDWNQALVASYQGLNRLPEAVDLAATLTRDYAWDPNAQTQYANLLANSGDDEAGLGWLNALIANPDQRWLAAEIASFRLSYINLAESHNRLNDVLRATEAWLLDQRDETSGTAPLTRWLSAMIRLGKTDEAYATIDAWLAEGAARKGAAFDTPTRNRLGAAIEVLTGRAQGVQPNDIPERFHRGLAKVVRKFALSAKDAAIAESIMNDYRFTRTEAVRNLRKHFTDVLEKRAATLELAAVNRLLGWVGANDPAVATEVWESVARALTAKWERERDPQNRDALAGPVGNILSAHLGAGRYLDFLRRRMNEAPETTRGQYAGRLFEALLRQGWSAELEAEAFALLPTIDFAPAPNDRLQVEHRVGALMRLNDWVLPTHCAAAWEKLEGKENLTRAGLAAKRADLLAAARLALLERLTAELADRHGEVAEAMRAWTNCERLYLMTLLHQDAGKIAAECWDYLNPQDLFAATAKTGRALPQAVLIDRHLAMLESLASQPHADPALVKPLLDWLARGIAAQPDEPVWKHHLHRLLVLLDRPPELKTALIAWTQQESETRNTWRIALGYLHAESADIAEAIREFEAVEQNDELGPAEYRALANWYLVLNRKPDSSRAATAQYAAMEEWALTNRIQQLTSRIERGFNNGTPADFDPAVVDMFRAIFRKAQNPGQHLYQLGSLYRYTRDFRLLECLPDGVVGNSAGQIYSFLGSLNGVLQYVNDEAVCDQLLTRLDEVRKHAKTRVDTRGLDLLELSVRRRAAEVLNPPGQQVPLALAAMQRAFAGDSWQIGERRMLAQWLAGLGTISQEPLAAEQRHELEALYQAADKGTAERLHIGAHWAAVVRGGGQGQQAVDLLGSALQEYRSTQRGLLTPEAQAPFDQWIGYQEADRHFGLGEKEIAAALEMKGLESMRQWLVERKYRLYCNALAAGGAVSLGEGRELFDRARTALADELRSHQDTHRGQLCGILIELYRAAHLQAKLSGVAADLAEFAGEPFDQRVPFQTPNYQGLVQQLGSALRETAGDRAALAFLITRCEREPESFTATGQGGWNRYGYQLAEYRSRIPDLGDLEPRLLKLVLTELRRELVSVVNSNRYMYHKNHGYFWTEKRADFLAQALAVLREKHKSLVVVKHTADYLFDGLDAKEEAVTALTSAYSRKLLDEAGISQLAAFLERMNRDAQALPFLVEVVAMNPANADYRRRLIGSLGRAGQPDQALAAVSEAITYFKGKHEWNETTLAPLAQGCHEGELWARGIELYDELIPLHQRTQPKHGIGNGTLSGYYTRLAECQTGQGNTTKAVDAAAAAIVNWGARHDQRAQALGTLRKVLEQAKDLDDYVALLDQQVAQSGLENPVLRKALGEVLIARKQFPKAILNLRRAVGAQPDDGESHKLLVSAYDSMPDPEAALRQLLDALRLSPRNLELLTDLANRFEKLGRADEAERARTGLAEALPNESEGHAMLAAIRQTQNRWPEAIAEWQRVAAIRSLEPTGLLNLAKAQTHEKLWSEAIASAKQLLAKEWPSRFGNTHAEAAAILQAATTETRKSGSSGKSHKER